MHPSISTTAFCCVFYSFEFSSKYAVTHVFISFSISISISIFYSFRLFSRFRMLYKISLRTQFDVWTNKFSATLRIYVQYDFHSKNLIHSYLHIFIQYVNATEYLRIFCIVVVVFLLCAVLLYVQIFQWFGSPFIFLKNSTVSRLKQKN